MPKIVDREARRQEVIAAVWRIIVRDGIEHASFREVATESGLAIGSIRHFFGSHEDLIVAAAQEVADHVNLRLTDVVAEFSSDAAGRSLAQEVLETLLPLDRQRHEEAVLWLSIGNAARINPALAEQSRQLHDGIRTVVRSVLSYTASAGDEVEVERLCVLIDGMAADAVLQPDLLTPEMMRAVLERALDDLQS